MFRVGVFLLGSLFSGRFRGKPKDSRCHFGVALAGSNGCISRILLMSRGKTQNTYLAGAETRQQKLFGAFPRISIKMCMN